MSLVRRSISFSTVAAIITRFPGGDAGEVFGCEASLDLSLPLKSPPDHRLTVESDARVLTETEEGMLDWAWVVVEMVDDWY